MINKILKEKNVKFYKLSEITDAIFSGGTPRTTRNEYYDGDIPWIRSGEIDFNTIYESERKITKLGLEKSSAKWVREQSVLIALTGATAGKSAVNEIKLTTNQSCACVEVNREILNYKFLYYYLLDNYHMLLQKTQGAMSSLNLGIIKNLIIPLPSLDVQNEIVLVLDKFSALEAELEAELEARTLQYRYYLEKLTNSNDIDLVKIGDVAKLVRGASPRPIKEFVTNKGSNSIPWVKISDTNVGDKYLYSTKEYITLEGSEKSRIIKPGDVILSNSMSYGRTYISKIKGCIHDGWILLSDFETSYLPDYLYYILNSNHVIDQFDSMVNSSSVKNLNIEIVSNVLIPKITIKEQYDIVNILDKFSLLVDDIKEGLPAEIKLRKEQYKYYRNKLLTFESVV